MKIESFFNLNKSEIPHIRWDGLETIPSRLMFECSCVVVVVIERLISLVSECKEKPSEKPSYLIMRYFTVDSQLS